MPKTNPDVARKLLLRARRLRRFDAEPEAMIMVAVEICATVREPLGGFPLRADSGDLNGFYTLQKFSS